MRVCMVAYTHYENDNRVRRYAEALARRGDHVDVIALRSGDFAKYEVMHGVHVYRIQKRSINEKYKLQYLAKILMFLFRSGVYVTRKHRQVPYDLFHIHSVPDFEVFSAIIPKLKGAKIILDIHDIVPEFYASKFKVSHDSLVFKALIAIEKISIAFSDHAIIANHIWEKRLLSRSVSGNKCSVYLNYPDPLLFHYREAQRDPKKLLFMYPGTWNWHQGLDIAIKAFALIKDELPTAELHLYGGGPEGEKLKTLAEELGVKDRVLFKGSVIMDEIGDIMANTDIAIVPKRNDPFGGEAFSTKIFEFMTQGIPVIVSATTIDKHYFNDSVVHFFEPSDEKDLARAMLFLARNKEGRDTLSRNALKFVEQYSWDRKKQDYFDLVDNLVPAKKKIASIKNAIPNLLVRPYYLIKPLLPRFLQILIRVKVVAYRRKKYKNLWPIDQKSSRRPVGWQGWPNGKQFALVLTHDVEGNRGIHRCLKLAELEKSLGFRSSFNFVGEDFEVCSKVMNRLRMDGFEIGLHGITHRGNLFESRKVFEKSARRINEYLQDFSIVGFRSPSMYHNMEWIHDLNVEYDSSTFDTDPFEPQSDGVGTIFPFFVPPKGSARGYVELPYTMPQDYLSFILMKEKNIDIWRAKLDWLAEHGGMALLISHPDYMHFDTDKKFIDEYPAERYAEFLKYVKRRYEGQYWNALPKEVAALTRESQLILNRD